MRSPRVRTFKRREHSPTFRSQVDPRPAQQTRKEQPVNLGVGVGDEGQAGVVPRTAREEVQVNKKRSHIQHAHSK